MNFFEAISENFSKYATFTGRAGRSEFWYFVLFEILAIIGLQFAGIYMVAIFGAIVLLPMAGVSARRLHDINMAGWWQLIGILPAIILPVSIIYFYNSGDTVTLLTSPSTWVGLVAAGYLVHIYGQPSTAANKYGEPAEIPVVENVENVEDVEDVEAIEAIEGVKSAEQESVDNHS